MLEAQFNAERTGQGKAAQAPEAVAQAPVHQQEASVRGFCHPHGMTSGWGCQNIQPVAAVSADLFILAWGMNDGCPANEFVANLRKQITDVRNINPTAEFILVATMLPNGEWIAVNSDRQIAYRDAMLSITEPGVAIANVTSVWEGLLKRKKHLDITGNGVNHPNDFGHRLYAQVLAALLIK
jgi:hypothetical protein